MKMADKIRQMKSARPTMKNAEIARMVGCSYPHVTQTLQTIPLALRSAHNCLSPKQRGFLQREAKLHGVTEQEMSVGFLRDAIDDAMESENVL
jgi:hypothetical protein